MMPDINTKVGIVVYCWLLFVTICYGFYFSFKWEKVREELLRITLLKFKMMKGVK